MPVRDGSTRLELAFARPVDLLNVLVADTGIVVDSPRLHKRRPFRQGTRIYLHREAFQIDAGEPVIVELSPFERTEMPRLASGLAGLGLAVVAAAFLIAPLRRARRAAVAGARPVSTLASERENVYEALRDLEHDHETGKVDDADYTRMRSELRAAAVELMRREREADTGARADAASPTAACPGCARPVETAWRFCSHCGARLEAEETA
jgi:cytochrome c-type biogenesis protein CcmI